MKTLIDEAQERYAKEDMDQALKMDLMKAQIVLLTRLSRVLLQVNATYSYVFCMNIYIRICFSNCRCMCYLKIESYHICTYLIVLGG